MIAREHLDRLAQAVGGDGVREHAPVAVDDAELGATLRPADGDSLARALAALGACGLAAIPRGGGSKLHLGNAPLRADVLLSSERLRGVEELDAGEGVCRARAGTPLSELRDAARAEGWELPFDPPGDAATLGGTLAAAAVGPRALGFGAPRDVVLGLDVALANGDRTRCGGRVVKNVTGYDLAKLYVGSLGTVCAIEAAWIRLRPRPSRAVVLRAGDLAAEAACEAAQVAARRPTARAAAVESGSGSACSVVVELAGDAPSVGRDAEACAASHDLEETTEAALDAVRARQGGRGDAGDGLRFRLAVLPSRLVATWSDLRRADARCLAYPGTHLVYATFPLSEGTRDAHDRAVDRAFALVARLAREGRGAWVCESAPPWVKRARDVFGASPEEVALARALKQRFDPGGVLAPGRFAGRT